MLRYIHTTLKVLTNLVEIVQDPSVHRVLIQGSEYVKEGILRRTRAITGQSDISEATIEAAIQRVNDTPFREALQRVYRESDSVIAALLRATTTPGQTFLIPLFAMEHILREHFKRQLGQAAGASRDPAVRQLINEGFARDIVDRLADSVAKLPRRIKLRTKRYSLPVEAPDGSIVAHFLRVDKSFMWHTGYLPGYVIGWNSTFVAGNQTLKMPAGESWKKGEEVGKELESALGRMSEEEKTKLIFRWGSIKWTGNKIRISGDLYDRYLDQKLPDDLPKLGLLSKKILATGFTWR